MFPSRHRFDLTLKIFLEIPLIVRCESRTSWFGSLVAPRISITNRLGDMTWRVLTSEGRSMLISWQIPSSIAYRYILFSSETANWLTDNRETDATSHESMSGW